MATLNIKNLPDGLYRRLRRRAKERHRSTAQEVTHILTQALAEPETRSLLELRGLGREAWQGVDAARHVAAERDSWD
jgi:plasmid stability protein